MSPVSKIAALAALVLAVLAGALSMPAAEAKDKPNPIARKVLVRTHKVIKHAWHAVKKHGSGKGDLRKAWIWQSAARKAIRNDKPALAARLSIGARAAARQAILANKGETVPADEAADAPEETQVAAGATDVEVQAAVQAEEAGAPSEEQILKEEPKAEAAE